jgi:hypothetical protein
MHGLEDVAGRAMNECGKQVADAWRKALKRPAPHIAFLIEEAGAQYSQSPIVAKGPLGDATSMIEKFGRHSSLLLVFSRSY